MENIINRIKLQYTIQAYRKEAYTNVFPTKQASRLQKQLLESLWVSRILINIIPPKFEWKFRCEYPEDFKISFFELNMVQVQIVVLEASIFVYILPQIKGGFILK